MKPWLYPPGDRLPLELVPGGAALTVREDRHHRFVKVELVIPRLGTVAAIVRNASRSGLGGRADEPLLVGERLTALANGVGALSGQIRWVKGRNFGMQLDAVIDPAILLASRQTEATRLLDALPDSHTPEKFAPPARCWRPGFAGRRH